MGSTPTPSPLAGATDADDEPAPRYYEWRKFSEGERVRYVRSYECDWGHGTYGRVYGGEEGIIADTSYKSGPAPGATPENGGHPYGFMADRQSDGWSDIVYLAAAELEPLDSDD